MSVPEEALLKQIREAGLPEPVREFRFARPYSTWRFDFAFPPQMLAVEIEGGIYTGGRHVQGYGCERDMVKYNFATLMGWRVLRLKAAWCEEGDGRGLQLIVDALERYMNPTRWAADFPPSRPRKKRKAVTSG